MAGGYFTLTVGPCQKCNFIAVMVTSNSARQQVHRLYFTINPSPLQTGSTSPNRFFPFKYFLFLSFRHSLSYELQQQLVSGVDDPPGEDRTVVVEVGPSEEHGQPAAPLSPHR